MKITFIGKYDLPRRKAQESKLAPKKRKRLWRLVFSEAVEILIKLLLKIIVLKAVFELKVL